MNVGPHRTARGTTMDHRDDARAEELDNLRLALATFALQLDAFEMRTRKGPFGAGMTPGIPVQRPDAGCGLQRGKNDWSIKSHGSKRAE
jgi:hypothetical protein